MKTSSLDEYEIEFSAGTLARHKKNLTEYEQGFYEERAAIFEYDAGKSRVEAEKLAIIEILIMRKNEEK